MQKLYNTIIQSGLIFLLIFTPLAFGTVQGWSITIMEIVTLLMATAWFLKMIHQGELKFTRTPLNIPLLLFALFILFQLLPLSPGVLNYLSPNTYKLYQNTLPDYHELKNSDSQSSISQSEIGRSKSEIRNPKSEITIYSHATQVELLKLLTYIAIFFLVINNVYKREQIKRIIILMVALGFALSVLAIIQKFSSTDKIYWFQKLTKGCIPFGPYVNRNHFAGYVNMIIPLAFGLFALKISKFHASASRKFSSLFSSLYFLYILVIMIAALFLSLSRGGMLSFASTMILMLGLYLIRQKSRLRFIIIPLTVFLFAFIFLVSLDITPIMQRLSTLFYQETDLSSEDRIAVLQDSLQIVKDYPVFGTGLGAFQYIYPKYRASSQNFGAYYDYAHNDYLQLLLETGILGFLLIAAGLLAFILTVLYKWGKRHDPFIKGLTICCLTGVFSMLLHSMVDFNLHIPANALYFSLLLGLTYSLVQCEGRSQVRRQRHAQSSLNLDNVEKILQN